MEIKREIIEKLSSKGILAYVAVSMADGTKATTAALAALVRAPTATMLEGLKDLSTFFPGLVKKEKNSWICGEVKVEDGVQILDSSRYRLFVDDLKKYWDYLNSNYDPHLPYDALPFSMSGKDGQAIRTFLADNPDWTQDDWRKALNNRNKSVQLSAASSTEPFYVWIGKLASYAAGPLDRWYKPVGGERHGKAIVIQQQNREAGSRFIDSVRNGSGAKGGSNTTIP